MRRGERNFAPPSRQLLVTGCTEPRRRAITAATARVWHAFFCLATPPRHAHTHTASQLHMAHPAPHTQPPERQMVDVEVEKMVEVEKEVEKEKEVLMSVASEYKQQLSVSGSTLK